MGRSGCATSPIRSTRPQPRGRRGHPGSRRPRPSGPSPDRPPSHTSRAHRRGAVRDRKHPRATPVGDRRALRRSFHHREGPATQRTEATCRCDGRGRGRADLVGPSDFGGTGAFSSRTASAECDEPLNVLSVGRVQIARRGWGERIRTSPTARICAGTGRLGLHLETTVCVLLATATYDNRRSRGCRPRLPRAARGASRPATSRSASSA